MDPKIEYIEEDSLVYEVRTYSNGNKFWHYNGQYHRLNGPAIEWPDGEKWYYINNNLHRLNGPAIEYANGGNSYYINGECFHTFEDYKEAAIQYKINKILNGL